MQHERVRIQLSDRYIEQSVMFQSQGVRGPHRDEVARQGRVWSQKGVRVRLGCGVRESGEG